MGEQERKEKNTNGRKRGSEIALQMMKSIVLDAVLCLPSFCNPNIALPMCWESITDFDLFNFSVRCFNG